MSDDRDLPTDPTPPDVRADEVASGASEDTRMPPEFDGDELVDGD